MIRHYHIHRWTLLSWILVIATTPQFLFAASTFYIQHNLVSDVPGLAANTDPNLVNPWGISTSAASPFWVSNNLTGTSTLYNSAGVPNSTVVTIPPPANAKGSSHPTGQVNNGTTAFVLPNGTRASFIFSTEEGTIAGWNGGATAITKVDNSAAGAVYKGLAIGTAASGPVLYAANFHSGTIDVFDGNYNAITLQGSFADPSVTAGFAPFNIQNLGGKLYVTYALQDGAKRNDVAGPGNGFVAVFDQNGNLLQHLVSNGPLNSPWGVAIAPAIFGQLSNALLVGNFGGSGVINAFDLKTGNVLGPLQDSTGKPIANQGLWALQFGNNGNGGDGGRLYFCAGPSINGAIHGLLGSIDPAPSIGGVVNAASYAGSSVAPGEIIMLGGTGLGPGRLTAATASATAGFPTTAGNTTVTFDTIPATILYASAAQTCVIVPYEIWGKTTTSIQVAFSGDSTTPMQVPVAIAAPGLFSLDGSGAGPGVILNQDGSVNSATKPAAAGSVVAIFGTGEGQTAPLGIDGVITGVILREPLNAVSLTIGGQAAKVVYAGSAPALVAGVLQVEAIVPNGLKSGPQALVLTVGSASSQSSVTVAVQ